MASYSNVESIKVSPGIGTARVGNSQPEDDSDRTYFYYGPEQPNTTVQPSDGPYKDATGRVLRQAQRFRVFAYDATGALIGEVTDGDTVNGTAVSIQWTAHLSNMKAANYAFQGQYGFNPDDYRNSNIPPNRPGTDPSTRKSLIIDPGPISISGVSQGPTELLGPGSTIFNVPAGNYELPGALRFDPPQGAGPTDMVPVTYTPATVSLGKLYTDEAGRLIVVGGEGAAGSCTTPAVVISKITPQDPLRPSSDPQYNGNSYFNNPGWYDDTAGGSIDAALVDQSNPATTVFQTEGNDEATGWVGVAPPKYAPTAYNIVSLLDLQIDLFPDQDPYTGAGPVYYALTGTDNRPYIAQTSAVRGGAFTFAPAAVEGQVTTMPGAIAVMNGKVFYAITGTDDRPYIASSSDGLPGSFSFQPASPPGQVTQLPPALAVFNGKLFYAITGTDDRPYIASSSDGAPGSFELATVAATSQVTKLAPALAAFNGQLAYAITGTDSRPYIALAADGQTFTFTPAAPAGQVTDLAPALATQAEKLYYAITGTDDRPYLASSTEVAEGRFHFTTVAPESQVTMLAPALTVFNGRLQYALTGADDRPNIGTISFGDPAGATGPTTTFETAAPAGQVTQRAPALAVAEPVSFYRDVFPFLKIATDYAWTSGIAYVGHHPGAQGDFLRDQFLDLLVDPTSNGAAARDLVFNFIRPPSELTPSVFPPPIAAPKEVKAAELQDGSLMPKLTGNGGSVTENTVNGTSFPNQWLSLTNHQLSKVQRWVNGDFEPGQASQQRWSDLPADRTLDFAALQPTVGGGFHPGIELTYPMQESTFFAGPFRFASEAVRQSIAAYMSIPWQGDFWSCNTTFWPAARPDISVFTEQGQLEPRPWFRGSTIPPQSDSIPGYNDGYQIMVEDWPRYGFVVPVTGQLDEGEQVFQEVERDATLDDPSVLASVTAQFEKTGNSVAVSSGMIVSQPDNPSSTDQQWRLLPSTASPNFFQIASVADAGKVLTVNGSTVVPAAAASPAQDSQYWQYFPSAILQQPGYPGVFFLQSRLNGELLSVDGTTVKTAAQGEASLEQLFQLEAAQP